MYKFLTMMFFTLSALSAIAGGLALLLYVDVWQEAAGWCLWSAVFYKAGGYFHKLTPKPITA
ncbi:MAG: hypothetical protein ACRDCE_15540 [Cetobacterium sp.]|uniref:hypothetical protein n=1 Tax=Cetobacterium sp. TaxID=2071632 RepID=UPI003EE6729D